MNRPRPLLRSLLAATCGTTLLAAAVLGTGAAAFAEEAISDAVAQEVSDTDADADNSDNTESPAADDAAAAEVTDLVDEADPATNGSAADDTAADEAAQEGRSEVPAVAVTEASAEVIVPSAQASAATAEATPVAVEVAAPSLDVDAPGSVPLAGDLQPLTITLKGWNVDMAPAAVRLSMPADVAEVLDLQQKVDGKWQKVDLGVTRAEATATFPVIDKVELQIGVSEQTWKEFWDAVPSADLGPDVQALLDEGSVNALAAPAEEEASEFSTIDFTTELLMGREAVGEPQDHVISVVTPKVDLLQGAPGEVKAGETFKLSYRISNRTGYDYPANAPIALFQSVAVLTDEEVDALDELLSQWEAGEISEEELLEQAYPFFLLEDGELTVSCSVDGGAARTINMTGEHDLLGPGGTLYSGGLASGPKGDVQVDCKVTVGAEVPDALLQMGAFLTVGDVPLYTDDEIGEQLTFIVGAEAPAPAPKPTPAQPAPVRPMPTPTNPPAAAPVRQVPATTLPRTGTDPLPLAAAGLGLVLAGAAAILGGRRRAHN